MNQIFSIKTGFEVPDGTKVDPFLNPKDEMSGLPTNLFEGFSIAAGDIPPHISSKIHIMPFVTQVTFVRSGKLTVVMKDPESSHPYKLMLSKDQAALTKPGTLFQLVNNTNAPCHVLYITSPQYLFLMKQINYDDAIVIEEDWHTLAKMNWRPPSLLDITNLLETRKIALHRLEELV